MNDEIDLSSLDHIQLPNPLVEWSERLPLWQRDALRRIAQKSRLTDEDFEELKNAMFFSHELAKKEIQLTPIEDKHCKNSSMITERHLLCSIGDIRNINRLAENQAPLRFSPDGITLIYGDNGSGKSGYCRVSKAICRARSNEPILGNVFSEQTPGKASASIEWIKEGETTKNAISWKVDDPTPDELSSMSVFDTANAAMYVDGKNQLEYLPYEVDLVTQLTELCTHLDEQVSSEIELSKRNLITMPDFHEGTEIYSVISQINLAKKNENLPSEESVIKLAEWNESKENELEALAKDLENDPVQQAEIRKQCISVFTSLAETFSELEANFTADVISYYMEQKNALKSAKIARDAAARQSFEDMPLSHVGTDAWKNLFSYAKAYSELVYPEKEFPNIESDAKCVLCQQPLDEDARKRFTQFDDFVKGKAEEEYKVIKCKYTDTVRGYRELAVPKAEEVRQRLIQFSNLSDERNKTAKKIVAGCDKINAQKDSMLAALLDKGAVEDIQQFDSIADLLKAEIRVLENEITELLKSVSDSEVREQKSKKLSSLSDNKILHERLADVKNIRNTREKILRLEGCKEELGTQGLSRKISELRKVHFTEKLNQNIRDEIEALDLSYLNVSVVDRTTKGGSHFTSDIGFKQKIKAGNGQILSEGEQRSLALACFFAEAKMNDVRNGLIIDDPVSSLDQLRLRRVAKRVANAAKDGHQVIVFTHNLVFFNELRHASAALSVPLVPHVIHSENGTEFGVIKEDALPLLARKVKERKAVLTEYLDSAKAVDPKNREPYERVVKDFYGELREAWERVVEEVLLGGVVERFQEGVSTQSLRRVEVTDDDYQKIFFAMKKASEFSGHDRAIARDMDLPGHEELTQDLDSLFDYAKETNKRNDQKASERRKLEEPPRAKLI